ncbi:plant intracellular Ras-group-related LRR protein 5 isoform X2 [Elaeis guineensis]|uniref:Plant intracellular Ras-group-related LRR protein 5 isoform X2 n=1 Tax=Elaeis guineensis var. tenera TaxID=51953 RepID=A0A6I9S4Y9_ELAGV|nr:plant intracellular Ras-group-related LRR protein 5 isoform X2 [Elaeis guineensis]
MGNLHKRIPPAVVEAMEEIVRVYRSLPPRPSVEEVEAAVAVIKSSIAEEELRIEEVGRMERAHDLPEVLFLVLQEVKKSLVQLQSHEQRRESLYVLELDKRFQVFDELIQRASKLVSSEESDGGAEDERKRASFGVVVPKIDKALIKEDEDEKKGELDGPKGLVNVPSVSPLKSEVPFSGGDADKLTLIQVASLIEFTAKHGTEVLNLRDKLMDRVEWLPLSLGKLKDITELDLSENRIMALPSTIGSLRFLTKLDIHSNQVINLPDSFGELSSLVDLDLHANQLKSLPALFGNLTSLANLDLSSNRLSVLPETFGNLTKLRRLNVETNELEELPYTIGSCTSLVELRLDFNQLKALPEAIGKLECLEVLTLHYNRIKGLPTTMASLCRLKELAVSFNELESIPESLCFLAGLVKLDVGRNFADLRTLPRSIGNLQMLQELDIGNNQIRILPESFQFLSKLRVFHADETPLEVPPREVVKLGAQAVVKYMADLVASNDPSSHLAERKGFWFCLLCCPCSKKHNKDRDFAIA